MAHFYATVSGARDTVATKTGTKASGMDAHVRGWDVGARIRMFHDEKTGKDRVQVYLTKGSNGDGREALLCDMDAETAAGYIGRPASFDVPKGRGIPTCSGCGAEIPVKSYGAEKCAACQRK